MTQSPPTRSHVYRRRGFTLVEVMLAVFIFAIGLIMVITIFPVGADWTRQATESTVAQEVAQNALTIIQSHFPATTPLASVPLPTTAIPAPPLMLFPGCFPNTGYTIPLSEMCYQFGAASPCPANPANATYFWTAYIRATNAFSYTSALNDTGTINGVAEPPGLAVKYDVYILVFKKGTPAQTFTGSPGNGLTGGNPLEPSVQTATYSSGTYNISTATWTDPTSGLPTAPVPGIGEYGIGMTSGTVFRQLMAPISNTGLTNSAIPVPNLQRVFGNDPSTIEEQVLIGQHADFNAAVSPLIYVYQTTLAWKHP